MSLFDRAEKLLLPFIDWIMPSCLARPDPRRSGPARIIRTAGSTTPPGLREHPAGFDAAVAQGVGASSSTSAGPVTWKPCDP